MKSVLDLIKKALIVLSVVANIVLGMMYIKVDTQYQMYRQFAQYGEIAHTVPNLPVLK